MFEVTPAGEKRSVAEGLQNPNGLAVDARGNLYIAQGANTIQKVAPDGSQSTFAAGRASGLAIDPSGSLLYYTNWGAGTVGQYFISAGGSAQVTQTGLTQPVGIAVSDAREIYVGSFQSGEIHKIDRAGNRTLFADLPSGIGFLTWSRGHLIATAHDHRIYEITPTGEVDVLAGSGVAGFQDGDALEAQLNSPNGIVASVTGGTLFFSEFRSKALRMVIRSPVSTSMQTETPPALFELEPAYPNPFAEETTLTYILKEAQPVRLSVYDALGKEVVVLEEGIRSAGRHQVRLMQNQLPATGLYAIRLIASKGQQERTMIHLR